MRLLGPTSRVADLIIWGRVPGDADACGLGTTLRTTGLEERLGLYTQVYKNKTKRTQRSKLCKNAKELVDHFQRGGLGPPGGSV